jgi:hypothetical protein
MTTEFMEVFSLEEGDQIIHCGDMYLITDFENDPEDNGIKIHCVDEFGYRRVIWAASPMDKMNLVCDVDH